MSSVVTDLRSNKNEQLVYAAEAIGRSEHRAAVFEAICFGRSRVKSVTEIVERTSLPRKRVSEEARKLVNKKVINQTEKNGEPAYERDDFLAAHRGQVLRLASDRGARESLPTKSRPKVSASAVTIVRAEVSTKAVRIRRITVDDIDSFAKVRGITAAAARTSVSELKFKRGLQKLVGEPGKFTDWGGEKADLWSTRLRIDGRRRAAAFALKGPGLKARLTPARMGKNGDQIQRLFTTSAEVFVVQHWREIDEAVVLQLETFAKVKSIADGKEIMFGAIDGADSVRLIGAYPEAFK